MIPDPRCMISGLVAFEFRQRRRTPTRHMANRTTAFASAVHNLTDPQALLPAPLKNRIHAARYWKEQCFGLSAESLIDKAVALECVGGTYGGAQTPSRFMCLVLKLLQLQPEHEIIVEYIKQDDFKYLRLLGATYLRLTAAPKQIYTYLEPLLADSRKVRIVHTDGTYELGFVDAVVDDLLCKEDGGIGVGMPRMPKRWQLEEVDILEKQSPVGRVSLIDEDLRELIAEREADAVAAEAPAKKPAAPPQEGDGRPRLNFLKRPKTTTNASATAPQEPPPSAKHIMNDIAIANEQRAKLGLAPLKGADDWLERAGDS